MLINLEKITTAKTDLREALITYNGNTKHPAIQKAIANLAELNPTPAPAKNDSLLNSDWLLISAPNFPQGEKLPNGKFAYTLGRLAFNMFQPVKLKIVIDRVLQPVWPIDEENRSHDIVVEFSTIDESIPTLKGVVCNLGKCHPINDNVLQIQFTGGTLKPQNTENLETWKKVFGEQTPTAKPTLSEKLQGLFLKLMFGLVPPQTINQETGAVAFTMKRSPKGNLSILYLDEELRITKGNKETILVCERLEGRR